MCNGRTDGGAGANGGGKGDNEEGGGGVECIKEENGCGAFG